ncbi:MAG: hypothetical protein L3J63_09870 [Geopsychrobacter sp.]|nr:hypothetical protein [Geopsychrobacter sp.]
MSLNSYLQELVGQKITGVVAMLGQGRPVYKIHLVLENGSYFEFYGQDIEKSKAAGPVVRKKHDGRSWGITKLLRSFGRGDGGDILRTFD